jgi:hypothetical protein
VLIGLIRGRNYYAKSENSSNGRAVNVTINCGGVMNWNLKDRGGTRVGAGVYIVTLETGEERIVKKAVIY